MRLLYFLIAFCFCSLLGISQSYVTVKANSEKSNNVLRDLNFKEGLLDSAAFFKTKFKIEQQLQTKGYLTPSFQTLEKLDSTTLIIDIGILYTAGRINPGNADMIMLGEMGIIENEFHDEWSLNKTQKLIEDILRYYENFGYPFSRVRLNKTKNDSCENCVTLDVFIGPYVQLDTVILKTESKIPAGYVKYHLGLKTNKPYKEKLLKDIPNKAVKEGSFSIPQSPGVLFEKERTSVFVYITPQKANRISGIAGINTNPDGSIFFTGELDLSLRHVFKAAEQISFNWSAPRAGSQQLDIALDLPYLFKSPFGVLLNFNLYREDTIFSNRNFVTGINVRPNANTWLAITYENKSAENLLGDDSFGDVNTKYLNLDVRYNRLNHSFLPTKGTITKVSFGQGNRKTEETSINQYTGTVSFKSFFTLHKNHKVYLGLKGQGLFNTPLVTNELYRIGGVNSIRGFNEQSLFASQYGFGQFEYRYFLERFTYAFLLFDYGYLVNTANNMQSESSLLGTGAGFSFYTKGGIFSIAFAVGKEDQLPFNFNNSKVHITYVNRF